MTKVLILGANGMLGSAVLRYFAARGRYEVAGSVRGGAAKRVLAPDLQSLVFEGVNVENADSLARLFLNSKPQVVINCVGVVKQLADSTDPLIALPINALLPHRVARLCAIAGARLIHISTDCVFSGKRGMYSEDDLADASDLYGRSKYLGEVSYPHSITLRTSIIGHELNGSHGLVNWFLAQEGRVSGYAKAIFSGLPTVELARVIHDFVIPAAQLNGLYHVSASPIDKYSLLMEVAKVYRRAVHIVRDDSVVIDRSLDSTRFRNATGYSPPEWPELVRAMHEFGPTHD